VAHHFGIPDDSPIRTGVRNEDPAPEPEPDPVPEPPPYPTAADVATAPAALPGMSPEVLAMAISVAVKAALEASAPQQAALSVDQITAAVAAVMAGSAENNAQAMKKALKPENDPAPMISVYNPLGDRDHPRPKLKCEFTLFDGIPIDGTTDTVEEITLMNELVAGDYWVTKSDNTPMRFQVREIRNDLGTLRRINMAFPYRDAADAAGVMPMVIWLRECVRQIHENRQRVA
jgi:hypothetical protein